MKCPVNYVHLLFAGQLDEIYRVARHAYGQLGVKLRVLHGVEELLAVKDIHVDMVPALGEITVQQADEVLYTLFARFTQCFWDNAEGVGNAVFAVVEGQARDRGHGGHRPVGVAATPSPSIRLPA